MRAAFSVVVRDAASVVVRAALPVVVRAAFVLLLLSLATLTACTTSPASGAWQAEETLKAADGQTWVVGSHLVTVSPETAQPPLGSTVRLRGQRTQRGELLIDSVEVLDTPAAQVQPTPKPAPRAQPTTPPRAPAPAPVKKPHRENNDGGDD